MVIVRTPDLGMAYGLRARSLRLLAGLTQQELAKGAGITGEEVDLFEHNLPVPLDARRKLLKRLWSRRACL